VGTQVNNHSDIKHDGKNQINCFMSKRITEIDGYDFTVNASWTGQYIKPWRKLGFTFGCEKVLSLIQIDEIYPPLQKDRSQKRKVKKDKKNLKKVKYKDESEEISDIISESRTNFSNNNRSGKHAPRFKGKVLNAGKKVSQFFYLLTCIE